MSALQRSLGCIPSVLRMPAVASLADYLRDDFKRSVRSDATLQLVASLHGRQLHNIRALTSRTLEKVEIVRDLQARIGTLCTRACICGPSRSCPT